VKGHRPATVYNYAATLDPFLGWLGGRRFGSVTLEELEAFLMRPRTKCRGLRAAPGTLRREVSTLRGLFTWLHARGYVESNPTTLLVAPRRPKREPQVIADDLWQRVWIAELTDADRVLLGLGMFCGLRRAEMSGLRVKQVDLRGRQLVRFERKGGGDAVLPFGMMLDVFERDLPQLDAGRFVESLTALAAQRPRGGLLMPWGDEIDAIVSKRPRSHLLPPGAVDPQIASKRLRQLLARLELSGAFPLHSLRRSCATNLARAGLPVQMIQRLLGHSSIETTMIYVRVSHVELADWFERSEHDRNLRRSVNRHA
jgi:integrase/recombinase XerD